MPTLIGTAAARLVLVLPVTLARTLGEQAVLVPVLPLIPSMNPITLEQLNGLRKAIVQMLVRMAEQDSENMTGAINRILERCLGLRFASP